MIKAKQVGNAVTADEQKTYYVVTLVEVELTPEELEGMKTLTELQKNILVEQYKAIGVESKVQMFVCTNPNAIQDSKV